MNYLTPEIDALSQHLNTNSLVRPTVSCGIFQDCEFNTETPNLFDQQILKKQESIFYMPKQACSQ